MEIKRVGVEIVRTIVSSEEVINTATTFAESLGKKVVAIKNHNNAPLNPKAQFNVSIRDIMNQRMERARKRGQPVPTWRDKWGFLHDPQANQVVARPMRLLDCCPISDGASCILLVARAT